ncbi:hypothetical protein [Streptomyces mirabilis]|uniref:hypothetical protein n=1 Tax=Streptomyces mirabilis TaxID=68239 RepID=UPI0036DF01B6
MSETNDLRSYLSALDALGDIQRIPRVIDPNLEAAAVTRRSTENGRPAPFFEHLSGVGEGFRMVGAPGALSSVPGTRWPGSPSPSACRTPRPPPNWSNTSGRRAAGNCSRRGVWQPTRRPANRTS